MDPYQEALDWIRQHPGTGSASSLAKLVLSLWNWDCAFSFRECVSNFDSRLSKLAGRMVSHFVVPGEDKALVNVGQEVCEAYPRLWEVSVAMNRA